LYVIVGTEYECLPPVSYLMVEESLHLLRNNVGSFLILILKISQPWIDVSEISFADSPCVDVGCNYAIL
jgi:hypothetical protein